VALEIRRLEQHDSVKDFDCGERKLNDYLRQYAWKNQQDNLTGVTYICVDNERSTVVLGYYSLAVSSVPRLSLPETLTRDLPRYRDLPVALLARLAVRKEFHDAGLGKALLADACRRVVELSKSTGCRFLIVDAYPSAEAWYRKFGFVPIEGTKPSETQTMFMDVKTLLPAL